ncbi:MAG TPA: thioredoxin domain-containing protein [Anaerolineales bacterium]|nr:thioredoxin domain-containing protein [Anaerolineales bacterium]
MSKRQDLKALRAKRQRMSKIGLIVGITLVVAAVAFAFIWPNIKPIGEIRDAKVISRPDQIDFNKVGDPNAPIKIVEYSDFQCPWCAYFTENFEQLFIDKYVKTGKVLFEYRSMGLFIGPESIQSMEAAYCAGDQGKFWDMHDIIFSNHNGENIGDYTDQRLKAFAEKIGLDTAVFNECFDSNKYEKLSQEDQAAGNAIGVQGTPSITINGTLSEVSLNDWENLQILLDGMLEAAE